MDYGKYKYMEKKRQQEAKKKQSAQQLKEVKIRFKIDKHDLETKERKIKDFLTSGHRVKLTLQLRGREIIFKDKALELVKQVIDDCSDVGSLDRPIDNKGRVLTAYLIPKVTKHG